ncbi:hypothetical protein SAMN02745824_2520 [Parasphingorhabdus marina DSM 22363]|uniref:PilZ domain-containing protein n=1 Tax=Parasphingorhabdus marina DSM 22363 TaxID=1123272 RepID=A0A1N6FS61_9SPHN|nr:hypothetical protein [Parasphingorhabdus marina]SIN98090.1 hypothetical protein SAMN02745824_2520 [Parasphingorhabdus marina DSM 22363]
MFNTAVGKPRNGGRIMIYGDFLQIDAQVKQANSSNIPCVVTTISDTIIKIQCNAELNPDISLTLKIPGMNILTANLLWKKSDEYGCQIDYTFHPAVIKAMMERLDRRRVATVS